MNEDGDANIQNSSQLSPPRLPPAPPGRFRKFLSPRQIPITDEEIDTLPAQKLAKRINKCPTDYAILGLRRDEAVSSTVVTNRVERMQAKLAPFKDTREVEMARVAVRDALEKYANDLPD